MKKHNKKLAVTYMQRLVFTFLLTGFALVLFGQTSLIRVEGRVNYVTSQNTYAKFGSTTGIQIGDTLYSQNGEKLEPLVVVKYLSSSSCSGYLIGANQAKINDVVVALVSQSDNKQQSSDRTVTTIFDHQKDSNLISKKNPSPVRKEKINGKVALLSYQSYSNTKAADFQRMRYTLSFNGKYLGNSRLSVESYLTFSHRLDNWAEIRNNVFNGLKIYDLAMNYEVSKNTSLWIGRKINPRISSIGAIDGVQAETGLKNFFAGAIVGFRPDYTDYGFNSKLLEYGAYIGHNYNTREGNLYTSIAFLQQNNNGTTDRRYACFQIDNSLVKNLNLFLSGEVDLYTVSNGVPSSAFNLTSLFLSLSYKLNHKLSLSASYDARKNVIYYETDKSYLDQLLEDATRQGIQLSANYHYNNLLRFGLNGGYRDRKDDLKPTENAMGYVTYTRVPAINLAATLSVNWINTSYINGFIYGLRLSKEILPGKLTADLNFQYVDHKLAIFTTSVSQMVGEFELDWNITRKLSFTASYEGTFESTNRYHQVYLSLIQRF
jgi:hypothetical protein